jgi:uncharacterized protein (TIGR01777 family)
MKILVTGGTGFIGTCLIEALRARGDHVTVITRGGRRAASLARSAIRTIVADPVTPGTWQRAAGESDAVINLAGESVAAGRWTAERKRRIRESRIATTHNLVEAISAASNRPRVLINASAIGYYEYSDDVIDEAAPNGAHFLATVVRDWEAEARRAETFGVRVVLVRIGLVLGRSGGALARMLPPFRLGLGGPLGDGRQWYSWVHVDDVVGLILFCLDHPVSGVVNATAPDPVPMKQFAHELGKALHRPAFVPVPAFVLRTTLGEMSEILLRGQRVEPRAALRAGYRFRHPKLAAALADLMRKPDIRGAAV